MSNLTIRTNNVPRLLLDWDQLTEKEQKDFDYLTEDEGIGRDFIRYRGVTYDLGEFLRCPDSSNPSPAALAFSKWDAYQSDSYFSGVLFRYTENDRDRVIMATYFS
jgi:hypothetical protein